MLRFFWATEPRRPVRAALSLHLSDKPCGNIPGPFVVTSQPPAVNCALSSDAQQAKRHAAHTHTYTHTHTALSCPPIPTAVPCCSSSPSHSRRSADSHQGQPFLHFHCSPGQTHLPDQLFGRENASRQPIPGPQQVPSPAAPPLPLLVGQLLDSTSAQKQSFSSSAPAHSYVYPVPPTLSFQPHHLPPSNIFPAAISGNLVSPFIHFLPRIALPSSFGADCLYSSRVAHHGWQTSENKRAATHGVGGVCSPKRVLRPARRHRPRSHNRRHMSLSRQRCPRAAWHIRGSSSLGHFTPAH